MPSVTETKAGTMTEIKERAVATSEKEVKTPSDESKVSSTEEAPIYNQRTVDALMQAAKSEWGRTHAEVVTERDGLLKQVQTLKTEVQDNAEEIKGLEAKLDDMTSDDPKRFEVVKELKVAREERRQLKTKLAALDDRETKLSEREKRVNSFEREVLIESIADEYESENEDEARKKVAKLKKAVSLFDNPTEEAIRTYPEIFGWKLKAEEEETTSKALKVYSGKTEGGGKNLPDTAKGKIKAGWQEIHK